MRGENDKNLLEQDWLIEVQMKIIDHFEMLFKKVFSSELVEEQTSWKNIMKNKKETFKK